MARQIGSEMPFDDVESEILYTRAALKADPDANDFLALTDDWLSRVAATRPKDLAAREAREEASALRRISNGRLDVACSSFGDQLYLACGKDRASTRWTRFFSVAVNQFIRQPLANQVQAVVAWLGVSGEPVLDAARASLDTWSTAAGAAIAKTKATAQVTAESHLAREGLAEDLTRARDGLEEALRARARERKLGRDWPKLFFRIPAGSAKATEDVPAEHEAEPKK